MQLCCYTAKCTWLVDDSAIPPKCGTLNGVMGGGVNVGVPVRGWTKKLSNKLRGCELGVNGDKEAIWIAYIYK